MSGQAEGTIAALLRHSTTTLVRRYAHLSPSHLKAAVEQVANFGKPSTPSEEAKEPADSNGTVTKTVTAGGTEEGVESEAVEKIGAGDGI
jgi:hypothetical protein